MNVGSLLLAPHNLGDDETLFAAFTCLKHRPHIVTVLRSVRQEANGITAAEREAETAAAAKVLGCTWEQWSYPDDDPPWNRIRYALETQWRLHGWTRVFAPWPEPGGHPDHNRVGELAEAVFGAERVSFYTTYVYGGPRTVGREVEYEPAWIAAKLEALLCYRSQIERGPRRMWMWPLNEYELP